MVLLSLNYLCLCVKLIFVFSWEIVGERLHVMEATGSRFKV